MSQTNTTLPVMYSTPLGIQEETYEESSENRLSNDQPSTANFQNVQNGTNNSSDAANESVNITRSTADFSTASMNGNTEEYEDVASTKGDYEPLKRVFYENIQSAEDTKVYTGLENKTRHSKV